MPIITWCPDNLNGVYWNGYATEESDEIDVKIEYPSGNPKTATLVLGLSSEGRSCSWYVKLIRIGNDSGLKEDCRQLQLAVRFQVKVGIHESIWSEERCLAANSGSVTVEFTTRDTLKYLKEKSKKQNLPVVFHFSVLRPVIGYAQNIKSDRNQPIIRLFPCETPTINLDIKRMRDREKYSDFQIICGKMEFKCHKFILASRSDVFDTMFSHDDTNESKSGTVIVTDVEPEIMHLMLDFVYTDNCQPSDGEEVMKLLICADKYNLEGLKKTCIEELATNMEDQDLDLVIKVFKLADMMELSILKAESLKVLAWRFKEVLDCESWPTIDSDPDCRKEILRAVAEYTQRKQKL